MQKLQKDNGFTIIEVVLVLAIAGLIFLMVFIALPALQRSQRDTARKNDVSAVAAAVTSFMSNNKGAFPDVAGLTTYVQNVSDNTDLSQLQVVQTAGTTTANPDDAVIIVTASTTCADPGAQGQAQNLVAGTRRQFTVVTRLESGNNSTYCLDS